MAGLTSTGFSRKTLAEIKAEIENFQKTNINSGLNLTSTSVFGQLNGIVSAKIDELWQLLQSLHASQYPDSASGAALDNAVFLTGITRQSEAKTKATLTLNLSPGTTVPIGSIVSSGGSRDRFIATSSVTNAGINPDNFNVSSEAEVTGEIPAEAYAIDTIETPITGWKSKVAIISSLAEPYSLSGKTLSISVLTAKTDNFGIVKKITFSTETTASAVVATINAELSAYVTATVAGAGSNIVRIENNSDVSGNSLEIINISPFFPSTSLGDFNFPSGLFKGFNQTKGTKGRLLETDAELRERRIKSLSLRGAGTPEAIRAAVGSVSGVSQTQVFENRTSLRDLDGRNPHSYEVVVNGGNDQEIANKIFEYGPAGIETSISAARVFGSVKEPFAGLSGKNLNISVDGAADVTPVFGAQTTAAAVAGVINVALIGKPATAYAKDGKVLILHNVSGTGTSLRVQVSSTADTDLGLSNDLISKTEGIGLNFRSITVTDIQLFTHNIKFSRPINKNIYIDLVIDIKTSDFPVDGKDKVKKVLEDLGNLQKMGEKVILLKYKCEVLKVVGVVDVTLFKIDVKSPPDNSTSNLDINPDTIAVFSIANIAVTTNAVT